METLERLLQQNSPYFTRQNLAVVLGNNRRTLDYRIKSLIKRDILLPAKSGFYINKRSLETTPNKDDFMEYVGSIMVYPSYVSLEYALSKYGFIPEGVFSYTYITTKKTRIISSGNISYIYKNIKQPLFCGYETKIFGNSVYFFASFAKAVFDYIYLKPYKNAKEFKTFLFDSRFNWSSMTKQDIDNFTNFVKISESKKMSLVHRYLVKEKII